MFLKHKPNVYITGVLSNTRSYIASKFSVIRLVPFGIIDWHMFTSKFHLLTEPI